MQLLNAAPQDAVTELLAALRVRSTVYCLSELREPWGFEVGGVNVAKFHLVLAGSCWLSLAGHEPAELHAGDLVILSRGERHAMSDRPGSPVTSLDLIVADHPLDPDARLTYGGTGALTRLLCGGFILDDPAPTALIGLLPPVLQMNSRSADITTWLEPVFALYARKRTATRPAHRQSSPSSPTSSCRRRCVPTSPVPSRRACWRPGRRRTLSSGRPWPRCTTGLR
jgi:hypothetical protein